MELKCLEQMGNFAKLAVAAVKNRKENLKKL